MGAIAQLFSDPLTSTPIVDYLRRDFGDFKSVSAAKICVGLSHIMRK